MQGFHKQQRPALLGSPSFSYIRFPTTFRFLLYQLPTRLIPYNSIFLLTLLPTIAISYKLICLLLQIPTDSQHSIFFWSFYVSYFFSRISLSLPQLVSFGDPPARKKRKYIRNSQRILNLIQEFEELLAFEDEDDDPWKSGYIIYLRTMGHVAKGLIEI